MLTNTGKSPKGNMRLVSDNGGKSAWLRGKEFGVSKRPGYQRNKSGLLNKQDKAVESDERAHQRARR